MDNDLIIMRQNLDAYDYSLKCRKIEWFDRLRKIVEDVFIERDKIYILSMMFESFYIKQPDRTVIYEFFCECDKIYGEKARFNDLSKQHQEIVYKFSF